MQLRKQLAIALAVFFSVWTVTVTLAGESKIRNVTIDKLQKKHFCIFLGGKSRRPAVTIDHDLPKGEKIVISLFDETSDGKTYQHGSKTVRSSGSGTITVKPLFFPPCNYTGSTSKYQFSVKAAGNSRTILWGRYNHKTGGIL